MDCILVCQLHRGSEGGWLTIVTLLDDNFLCNTCTVSHCPAPDLHIPRHTYLHALVRCKSQANDGVEPNAEGTHAEARLLLTAGETSLEREVSMLRQRVQDQSVQLQNVEAGFVRLERLMQDFFGHLRGSANALSCIAADNPAFSSEGS